LAVILVLRQYEAVVVRYSKIFQHLLGKAEGNVEKIKDAGYRI
jgi:hypothetical protein